MRKRIIAVLLVCVILCCSVHAAEPRISFTPTLSFSGTTADCSVVVSALGQQIVVVLELWDEDGLVDSWTKSGNNYVRIEETCYVVSGETYTLEASGTIGGVAFDKALTSKTCP